MAENSHIGWTDHTFNPWIGCTKVSPGCAHCYAETLDKNRYSKTLGAGTKAAPVSHWGTRAPRHRTSTWGDPLKWNRQAEGHRKCPSCNQEWRGVKGAWECFGCNAVCSIVRPRVFSASLADWLDDEVPIEWLADFLKLIHETPNLDWQLLTKRPENFRPRMSAVYEICGGGDFWHWLRPWLLGVDTPSNVWIGTTVENQETADSRIPELLEIPARVRFLSCEPLLGPLNLQPAFEFIREHHHKDTPIHWVICGGESGKDARPMNPDWARSLRDQCAAAGVPFFFKQWGEWVRDADITTKFPMARHVAVPFGDGDPTNFRRVYRVGTKNSGRTLDGIIHNAFPEVPAR